MLYSACPLGNVANVAPRVGYVAGLVLDAFMRSQLGTPHEDPLQLTAYFLKFLEQGPFEVHVRALRRGTAFTNLSATLFQKVRCLRLRFYTTPLTLISP